MASPSSGPNGPFCDGGSNSDNGQTGRKLVMDCYGPRVPIGVEAHGLTWNETRHAPRWQGHASNLFPVLERLFSRPDPPTAFITLGLFNLLPVLTWLGSRRLRVPDEVSVVHILDDPLLESMFPVITRFANQPEKITRATLGFVDRLLRTGKPFNEERMIPMHLVEGRSVGPPGKVLPK
jgi:DNA-binding LacI/PurR family transcriptional regulator